MARLRFDNQTGTLGATLTAGGLTATLASPWAAATVVGPDYVAIELEPPTAGVRSANYEVVYAQPVNGSASVTLTARGQEGTTAVQHNAGIVWAHGPTAQDFVDSDFAWPGTTAGDLAVGGPAPSRLAQGSEGTFLGVVGGVLGYNAVNTGITWPLSAGFDMVFRPTGVANTALDLTNIAAAVNGFEISGQPSGTPPKIAAVGADTNVGLNLHTQGAGPLFINDVAGTTGQVLTSQGPSAAPLWTTPSASVSFPLTSAGNETFQPNGIANNVLNLFNAPSAVNGIQVFGPATGSSTQITAIGSDTTVGLSIVVKDTAATIAGLFLGDSTKNCTLQAGAITGKVAAKLALNQGGAGGVQLVAGNSGSVAQGTVTLAPFGGNPGLTVAGGGNTNGVLIINANSGAAPSISASGDTNVDLSVSGAGTGVVNFAYTDQATVGAAGAASALPALPSKYVKIKSNGVSYVVPAYLPS